MKKKNAPTAEMQSYADGIRHSIESWKSHKKNGCHDPTYADGTNMNLLRNHVIYYKRQMDELHTQTGVALPPERHLPTMPYVDPNWFAKPKSARAQRIMSRPGWECYAREKTSLVYDEDMLSFL